MKTVVVLVIDHKKPIADLAKLVEQRAYTIDGVEDSNVVTSFPTVDPITSYYTDRNNGAHAAKAP